VRRASTRVSEKVCVCAIESECACEESAREQESVVLRLASVIWVQYCLRAMCVKARGASTRVSARERGVVFARRV
jgi:hypothetical protein